MNLFKKIFKQTAWQLIGKGVTAISTIVSLGFITRSYGAGGTGVYTLVLTYLAFFYLAADLGLNAYVLPHFINDKKQANLLFNSRLYWSLVLVLVANVLALLLPFKSFEFTLSVLFGSLTIICIGIYNSANLIFQKELRYDKSVVASSIGSLISLPILIYFSLTKAPIFYLMLAPLFGLIVNNLILLLIIKSYYKFKLLKPNFNFLLSTMKIAWPISLTLILNIIYFRVDSFILASSRNFTEVGIYNLAYSIFQNILVVPTFIMNGFYPLLLESFKNDKEHFFKLFKIGVLGMVGLGIAALFSIWIFAPFIINILSTQGFEGSIHALKILSISFPAFFVSSILMWICLSLRKYKILLFIYSIGLGSNIILNYFFIPIYGYVGASFVTVVSEYLIVTLLTFILYYHFKFKK